jgi:hypothetical protein
MNNILFMPGVTFPFPNNLHPALDLPYSLMNVGMGDDILKDKGRRKPSIQPNIAVVEYGMLTSDSLTLSLSQKEL